MNEKSAKKSIVAIIHPVCKHGTNGVAITSESQFLTLSQPKEKQWCSQPLHSKLKGQICVGILLFMILIRCCYWWRLAVVTMFIFIILILYIKIRKSLLLDIVGKSSLFICISKLVPFVYKQKIHVISDCESTSSKDNSYCEKWHVDGRKRYQSQPVVLFTETTRGRNPDAYHKTFISQNHLQKYASKHAQPHAIRPPPGMQLATCPGLL